MWGNIFVVLCIQLKRTLIPVTLVKAFMSFVMQTQRFQLFSDVLAIERSIVLIIEELPVIEGIC